MFELVILRKCLTLAPRSLLQPVVGDVTDIISLRKALRGVSSVICSSQVTTLISLASSVFGNVAAYGSSFAVDVVWYAFGGRSVLWAIESYSRVCSTLFCFPR